MLAPGVMSNEMPIHTTQLVFIIPANIDVIDSMIDSEDIRLFHNYRNSNSKYHYSHLKITTRQGIC